MYILYILIFILGTIIGSFLNVVIYRIPRNESIIFPASHCTYCNHELKPFDLIPIISYVLLKGKCRYCGKNISLRYPIVELITGLIFVIIFHYFNISILSLSYIFLSVILVILSFIDAKHKLIPNKILLTGLIGIIIFRILMYNEGIMDYLIGSIIGGGIFLLVSIVSGEGMGGGDIKLMALIGLFIGRKLTLLTMFFAVILGAIVGVVLIFLKIKTRKDAIPFVPFISIGCIISILYGYSILNWYISFIRR